MHLQSFYVYVLLLDAHVTLHLAPLRPLVALLSTSTLQLPNTSLNGGNVCLATLHSSDRDLQPFYYV